MKRGIAALMIAAAMISSPGILNAGPVFSTQQLVQVNDQTPFNTPGSSFIAYKYNGESTFRYTARTYGSYNLPYAATNNVFIAYLYDYSVAKYVDYTYRYDKRL